MTPFEIIRAAEARQDAALAVHFAEAEGMREVHQASVAYWPRLLTPGAAYREEDVCAGQILVAVRLSRYETVLSMRAGGATFREIGVHIGVKAERARQIWVAAVRKKRSRA